MLAVVAYRCPLLRPPLKFPIKACYAVHHLQLVLDISRGCSIIDQSFLLTGGGMKLNL